MAPVSDYSINAPAARRESVKPEPKGYYRVRSGDTLYSIAWRYGKDYRGLARANGIGSNYRIFPGQLVRIAEAPLRSPVKTAQLGATESSGQQGSATRAPISVASVPNPMPASTPAPAPASTPAPTPAPVPTTSNAKPLSVPEPVSKSESVATGPVVWRWPAAGRVIQSFGAKGKANNGLNISGNRGEPVLSAAAGMVVYAGDGLLGYGNLVIINHNETFLSAYAHNDKLLVKERERVGAGQQIAEIGNSGVTRTMLHFEIRKEGKPVDPIRYLPRR